MDSTSKQMTFPPRKELGAIFEDENTGEKYIDNGKEWQPLRGRKIEHSIQTYSGYFIWPLDPHVDEIHVEDIAHGIACEYRYGNQSPYPYSVAWHSVSLSYVVPEHLMRFALVHDAPEAYIKDMPRTIRCQEPFKTEYDKIDNRLLDVVCERFTLENQMDELKEYDIRMSHSEMIVWSETNPIYMAKMNALKKVRAEAYDERWLSLVRACPMKDHWQISKKAWLKRFEELFG